MTYPPVGSLVVARPKAMGNEDPISFIILNYKGDTMDIYSLWRGSRRRIENLWTKEFFAYYEVIHVV